MKLFRDNNVEILKTLESNSIDSIVTDPPYGLSFMNKKWDHDVPSVEFWKEVLRVLKPGGHVLSFGGTRTYHRMAVNIEDAGFEIRDQIMWLYGSGFPKSHNISKGIDKKFGCERDVVGLNPNHRSLKENAQTAFTKEYQPHTGDGTLTKPASDQAKQWDGFGTALKPANEPIVLARKPLSEKTIVDNVLKHGTGAINIDGCRVNITSEDKKIILAKANKKEGKENSFQNIKSLQTVSTKEKFSQLPLDLGRWPANVILDEQAGQVLDEQSGVLKSGARKQQDQKPETFNVVGSKMKYTKSCESSVGGASRFFYCAKASKSERNRGLEGLEEKNVLFNDTGFKNNGDGTIGPITQTQNHHPTVKPIKLMEYLVKLITPPNGTVLDPFMGSGSTGVAAKNLGFDFVGMELDEQYFEIAKNRIENARRP